MANLTEHVMINKWDDEIRSAIQEVGGDVTNAPGLPDYAKVIKTQLISNTAEENGIYQDFLYMGENEQTYIYPWEGEPTKSKHAPQSSIVAESIKSLYNIMNSTERFNILLVDEIPSKEINLSAIYLLKIDSPDSEYDYSGCYFVKNGKNLKRIDIPEFKINLDELFFLTREEYKSGFSGYVEEIQSLLKKIFGKYWSDDGFYLEEVIDDVVEDLTNQLKQESEKILKEVSEKLQMVEEGLVQVSNKVDTIESNVDTKLSQFETNVNSELVGMNDKIDTIESNVDTKLSQFETNVNSELADMNDKIDTIESNVNSELVGMNDKIDTIESNVDTKLSQFELGINSEIDNINDNIETFKNNINTELGIVDGKVDSAESRIDRLSEVLETNNDAIQNSINDLNYDIQQYKEESDSKFLNKILDRIDLEDVNKLK